MPVAFSSIGRSRLNITIAQPRAFEASHAFLDAEFAPPNTTNTSNFVVLILQNQRKTAYPILVEKYGRHSSALRIEFRHCYWLLTVAGMGVSSDDAVLIQNGKKPGEPHVITVNCPDKHGLGCDICHIILDFVLYITKGAETRWPSLKSRLQSLCPCSVTFYLNDQPSHSAASPVYFLKFFCLDRKGLLHDVTQVLTVLELAILKVKVTTTPDGRVLDLFFITDNMELLHTKERQNDLHKQLDAVLGESCVSCELKLAGPEYEYHHAISSLSPSVAEELFRFELSDKESLLQALSSDMTRLKKANVVVDNSLSPAHTLLQISCVEHKGLFYDILRTLKDRNIKLMVCSHQIPIIVIYTSSFSKKMARNLWTLRCKMDYAHLKVEMLHPLHVVIGNRGPDTELLVANPVELAGKGRPRVFYDVTLALKALGICIFSAEIGRHSSSDHEWEVYRFLLDEKCGFQLSKHAHPWPAVAGLLEEGLPSFIVSLWHTSVSTLQKLKVEPVLLHYLSQIKVLRGMELRMATSTRLKTCLYSFTSPGGPMYPTRAVRHVVWDALHFLFPASRTLPSTSNKLAL
ncbi:ACT domain-containing protein ACR9 [Hibiscus syriacus]|uniref:ACT domain-containing protein ACR n=1 Tax=Hibiscus syriacus TaxID=106335 RepID=A0A6A2YM95_HIBSY|nr:ACT domain-containing protein ACR9 [Hibiscus syriacus]